jgi:hypothetical protein
LALLVYTLFGIAGVHGLFTGATPQPDNHRRMAEMKSWLHHAKNEKCLYMKPVVAAAAQAVAAYKQLVWYMLLLLLLLLCDQMQACTCHKTHALQKPLANTRGRSS